MFLDVVVPALSERPQDILALASHFLARCVAGGPRRLSAEAERALLMHRWSGNVRELRNVLVRAAVLCDGEVIDVADLELRAPSTSRGAVLSLVRSSSSPAAAHVEEMPLSISQAEQRERFIRVLQECGNNRAEAARRLGLSRSTLHAQLRRAGLPLKFARG